MMLKKFLKGWTLPIAMVAGFVFHNYMEYVKFVTPYLIFVMLFVTYTRIRLSEIRITPFQFSLLTVQLIGCWGAYFLISPYDNDLASGIFVCFFICTATSAPVVASMLGGSISKLLSYSLLSNITFAIAAPFFLSYISDYADVSFADSFKKICLEVLPMLLVPLIAASLLRRFVPRVHRVVSSHQSVSFYLWAVALFIAVGNAVSFAVRQPAKDYSQMLLLSLGALVACVLQFVIGRVLGRHFGDPVVGAQGLGQKNTILGIWVAMTYLHPITSLAPAAYILWQNIINSTQLYLKARKE